VPKRYVLVDNIEEKVEKLYDSVQLTPEETARLRIGLEKEVTDASRLRKRQAARQKSRLTKLTADRGKLMQALYANAIPLDLFREEQERISRESAEAEAVMYGSQDGFAATERAILQALDLAENLHDAYLRSSPECDG
jgi:site-specific DNA recombinase